MKVIVDMPEYKRIDDIARWLIEAECGVLKPKGGYSIQEYKPLPEVPIKEVAVLDKVDIPERFYISSFSAPIFHKGDIVDLAQYPALRPYCTIKTEVDLSGVGDNDIVLIKYNDGVDNVEWCEWIGRAGNRARDVDNNVISVKVLSTTD